LLCLQAFDSDQDGQLSCSQFYGGLTWLGIELSPDDVYSAVRCIDSHNNGSVSADDFHRVFAPDKGKLMETSENFQGLQVPPRNIPELSAAHSKSFLQFKPVTLDYGTLSKLQVRVKPAKSLTLIWTTFDSTARSSASVWACSEEVCLVHLFLLHDVAMYCRAVSLFFALIVQMLVRSDPSYACVCVYFMRI
jgi:hypothetical protein